jgi:hypothetical protein
VGYNSRGMKLITSGAEVKNERSCTYTPTYASLERYVGLTNASSLQCIKYATVLRRWCGAVTRSILCVRDCDSYGDPQVF